MLGHADGVCHVYVDSDADLERSLGVVLDAKCQYPAVCNAAETLLVHRGVAGEFLPVVAASLKKNAVELRGDEEARRIVPGMEEATEEDWRTEYNDLVLSIRVVPDIDEAVRHINAYGSGHTDAILTENPETARLFMDRVDSASVMVNASTRFADGQRYGLGAEVGISTAKIHARGPVGLEGLVLYQYRLEGDYHKVADYEQKPFKHLDLEK